MPSFTSMSLQRVDEGTKDEAYQEPVIRGSAGTMYAGEWSNRFYEIGSLIVLSSRF